MLTGLEQQRKSQGDVQETEAEHDPHTDLLLPRDLEASDEAEGERVC